MRCTALLLVAALGATGCSSSTAPRGPVNPQLIGSWFDSTSYLQQVNVLNITGTGDSLTVSSPEYYLRAAWNGRSWWQPEDEAALATGTVSKDSVALCDPGYGGSCPNEIAYLRGNTLVLYLLLNGSLGDSVNGGVTYVHQAFQPTDTIPPADAPAALALTGVWLSDSVASSCTGVAQMGLVAGTPMMPISEPWLLQLYSQLYVVNGMARPCGSSSWNTDSTYFADPLPYPCTPADNCFMLLDDTVLTDTTLWFLSVATEDSLVVDTLLGTPSGFVPSYFLRDSGATTLARIRNRTRPQSPMPTRIDLSGCVSGWPRSGSGIADLGPNLHRLRPA
jgi:hypothetical protein